MKRVGLVMIIGLMLAACAPAATVPTASAPTNAPAVVPPTTAVKPTTAVASPTAVSAAPTDAPTRKAVKAELEATDPGTVQLAAGKPQFVEFFAFW
ncbi:MAG: hypothetical protein HY870_13660 [Chloroflexi bacterium]|nr:hypothetical protein [Chloroflexota bacterium]